MTSDLLALLAAAVTIEDDAARDLITTLDAAVDALAQAATTLDGVAVAGLDPDKVTTIPPEEAAARNDLRSRAEDCDLAADALRSLEGDPQGHAGVPTRPARPGELSSRVAGSHHHGRLPCRRASATSAPTPAAPGLPSSRRVRARARRARGVGGRPAPTGSAATRHAAPVTRPSPGAGRISTSAWRCGMSSGPSNGPGDVDRAHRDAQAAQLRRSGLGYRQIAHELGMSTSGAYDSVQRALKAARREPAEHLIELEAEHLDRLRRDALDVLTARHPLVQAGEIVHDTDGHELQETGPVIAAIRALLGIAERRAKLLGLDAPTRVDLRATLAHAWAQATLEERDWVLDQEIREMREELERRGRPTPPPAETLPGPVLGPPAPAPEPGDQAEILARTVEAALDAAGVPPEAREPAYRAVEDQFRHRGPPVPR